MATTTAPVKRAVEEIKDCPDCLAGNLSWLLSQAHYALLAEVNRAFAPLGISSRGYNVLAAAQAEQRTQSELAELVGLDKTTMVVTVDELEKAGLAERRPSETDRRARVIVVTEKGERMVEEGAEILKQIQADVLDHLPSRERQVFLNSLAELVRGRLAEPVACPGLRKREPR